LKLWVLVVLIEEGSGPKFQPPTPFRFRSAARQSLKFSVRRNSLKIAEVSSAGNNFSPVGGNHKKLYIVGKSYFSAF